MIGIRECTSAWAGRAGRRAPVREGSSPIGVALTPVASSLQDLYRYRVRVPRDEVPQATRADHTMGSSIDAYVAQRVPGQILDQAISRGQSVEVHGIYPAHVARVRPGARRIQAGHPRQPMKIYNVVRPQVFVEPADRHRTRGTLVVAVPPGRDYVLHNASLVRHYVAARGHPADLVSVVRYPQAEATVAEWTGLSRFVAPGDRVLLGYVEALLPLLLRGERATIRDIIGNAFYGAVRLDLPDRGRLCLLGVRFSFWGCISARLVAACQHLGADEVVYTGKLGTLTSPADIYQRLFAPSSYLDHRSDAVHLLTTPEAPPNRLLQRFPELDTGTHMSVGTVLEENIAQRARAESYAVRSIDNEIAQMARALAAAPGHHRTSFAALHFATDYLLREGERERPGIYNLTNHRRDDTLGHKHRMLAKIAEVLRVHYTA